MTKTVEHKLIDLTAAEFKFDADSGIIEGYASVFGGVDSYGDTVMPGAYKRTLTERQRGVKMRFNHFSQVVGKWTEIQETDKGLRVRGQLTPGHSLASDVLASLKHGAIDGLSIGYFVVDSEKNDHGGRDLKDIELVEISVVEEPADMAARIVAVKSDIEKVETKRDFEGILRDAGFSGEAAKALMSRYEALVLRDGEQKQSATEMVAIVERIKSIKV